MQHRVERIVVAVSGVATVSEEGAAGSKLTIPIQRTKRAEILPSVVLQSDYGYTPSSSFESSSTGAYKVSILEVYCDGIDGKVTCSNTCWKIGKAAWEMIKKTATYQDSVKL
ncbi:hypothetical protein Ahy_A02g007962 [Arachis hypogaea]|uniref:Uncharacterized protein n=1 Tax=Arachis hypogaea TaxID=3818 RepID=A0A445EE85_ARAHY|nr:hypothetical protein Ahy_A02g007962 [Arachis hypogaea]